MSYTVGWDAYDDDDDYYYYYDDDGGGGGVCVCVCVCVSFCVHVSTMKRQNRASRSCFSSASFMLSYVVQSVVKSLP